MNFLSMEYFTVVTQERSFTKAAERLHMTQQSLSAHIAGMEKELGAQLLIRKIPLELTYAGEVLLRYAASFQRDHDAMLREFCDITQNQKGLLRVGAGANRGLTILPGAITEFQKLYPNIIVEMTEASNDTLHQKLLDGAVDLAIANFPESLHGVGLRDFYKEEIVLLVERESFSSFFGEKAAEKEAKLLSGDFSVLKSFPFVLGGVEDIDARIARMILRQGGISRPVVKAVSHNVRMLMTLCVRGIGACFCPENLARATLPPEQLDALMLLRLGEKAQYQIHFGYQASNYQWSVVEAFMNCAQKAMRG